MPTLTTAEIAHLLTPYVAPLTPDLLEKLSLYLDLLLKWNARTNLTAIRNPEEIVTRHFGESLFAARHLGTPTTLLDYGSGAGFPGLPIALLHPEIRVTLAESQNKKSAFVREAVRTLCLTTEVWSRRVEDLPRNAGFDCITMRAVDAMQPSIEIAKILARQTLVLLTTRAAYSTISACPSDILVPMPGSLNRIIVCRAMFHVEHEDQTC